MVTLYTNDPKRNVGSVTTHDPRVPQAVAQAPQRTLTGVGR